MSNETKMTTAEQELYDALIANRGADLKPFELLEWALQTNFTPKLTLRHLGIQATPAEVTTPTETTRVLAYEDGEIERVADALKARVESTLKEIGTEIAATANGRAIVYPWQGLYTVSVSKNELTLTVRYAFEGEGTTDV